MSAPAASGSRGLKHAFKALSHRDFAYFWSGAALSNIGTWMQRITVPFVLYSLTGSAAWIGLGTFLEFLPMMAMNSVGGVLADRIDRRRLLIGTQVGQLVLGVGLWALWVSGNGRPGLIVAVVAGAGVVAGIQTPVWQSFVPQLVPRERLLNAITLNSTQTNIARVLGPALGGLVLAAWGAGAAFLVNGLSYLFVVGALLLVRAGQPVASRSTGRMAGEFGEAIRYTRRHTGLALAVGVVGLAGLLGAPIVQLMPVFAEKVYGVGETAYGVLTAAMGVGAVVGAVVLGAYGDDIRRSRLAVGGVLLFGVTALVLAISTAYWEGILALCVMGGGYIVIASSLNTSVQVMVAEEMRGRVVAIYMMAFLGGFPLGALLLGRLTDLLGPQTTTAIAGGVLTAVALALAARRSLTGSLDVDSLDDSTSPAPAKAMVAPVVRAYPRG